MVTGYIGESQMKVCTCCGERIPPTAVSLICGPCIRAHRLYSPRVIRCKVHKNVIDPKEVTP